LHVLGLHLLDNAPGQRTLATGRPCDRHAGKQKSPVDELAAGHLGFYAMSQPVSTAERARHATGARDVIFVLYSRSWAAAVADGQSFSEARLAAALPDDPRVARVLLVNPYRSVAARAWRLLRPRYPEPPQRERVQVHEPLRLRRSDPVDSRRTTRRYEASLRRAASRLGLERPAVITANPLLAGFGAFDWAGQVTFYAWDDWTSDFNRPHLVPGFNESFAEVRTKRRRVCAVSEAVLERIGPTGPHAVIPNGLEPAEWRDIGAPPGWFIRLPRPRLLYVGSLDDRIDVEQVAEVAGAYPDGSVVLVGPLQDEAHFAAVRERPNVVIRAGLVPRPDVVRLVGAAEVCLIPHVGNRLTEAMSPLKLYEYLAAGRPVAAVDLPPIAAVEGRVALAPAGGDLAPAVAQALALGPAPEAERLQFVARHAWSRRFDELLTIALAE
jgi:teichuronic acid biosynthesis glycosyltransferase TuaH